jgi:predicted nucleic acid-binding protein
VKFWDASAVVPMVVAEPMSAVLRDVADEDPVVALWWGTSVEALSGLCRKARDGELDSGGLDGARDRLWAFLEDAHAIAPGDQLRDRAHRLLAVHALRAADALQLAAALVWADERPAGLEFVSLDDRLGEAARREGFRVVP